MGAVAVRRHSPEEVARAWAERTCAEQGVPVKVTDPEVIEKAATLLGQTRQTGSTRSGSKAVRPGRAG
jgi:hypothetical protein